MGWDGWDGMDGISKVSFNFLYTLWVYRSRLCLLIYIYIVKVCHQLSIGFQNDVKLESGGMIFKITIFHMGF